MEASVAASGRTEAPLLQPPLCQWDPITLRHWWEFASGNIVSVSNLRSDLRLVTALTAVHDRPCGLEGRWSHTQMWARRAMGLIGAHLGLPTSL